MSKVVLIFQEKIDIQDSMELLFTELSKNGNYIEKIEDGKVYFQGEHGLVGDIYFLDESGTKNAMETEAITLRDKMHEAFRLMKSQGVEMPITEVNKLKEQFHFIPTAKAKVVTTPTEVKEPVSVPEIKEPVKETIAKETVKKEPTTKKTTTKKVTTKVNEK